MAKNVETMYKDQPEAIEQYEPNEEYCSIASGWSLYIVSTFLAIFIHSLNEIFGHLHYATCICTSY